MSRKENEVTIIKNEPEHDTYFLPLESALRKKGYEVKTVRLPWKRHTLLQSLHELERQKFSPIVIGFSINAFFTLFLKHSSIKKIIACSPSPVWKEVFNNVPISVQRTLGERRINDIKIAFSEKKMNKVKKIIVCGSNEIPEMLSAIKSLNSKTITIEGVAHDLNEQIETIIKILEK